MILDWLIMLSLPVALFMLMGLADDRREQNRLARLKDLQDQATKLKERE